jgi:hypothetical protein
MRAKSNKPGADDQVAIDMFEGNPILNASGLAVSNRKQHKEGKAE